MYTYFIISPGAQLYSYVQYADSKKGNYIKFGDTGQVNGHIGIRNAYMTHNPDIGVAAIMDSTAFANPYLGTVLKNYIISKKYKTVDASEWFSIDQGDAWKLFLEMQKWDNRVLQVNDLARLQTVIDNCL